MPPMHSKPLLVSIVTVAALLHAGCATPDESVQDDAMSHTITTPESIVWGAGPDSLPAGARAVVLSGDPAEAGPFTMRIEVPAGYHIPHHTHPRYERVTVLSGSAHLGTGADGERANATALPTGTYFELAPGTVHFFFTEEEGTVLQLHGEGPWAITYVDEDDDPRNRPAG